MQHVWATVCPLKREVDVPAAAEEELGGGTSRDPAVVSTCPGGQQWLILASSHLPVCSDWEQWVPVSPHHSTAGPGPDSAAPVHIPLSRRAAGASSILPGSSQGCQDKRQPRHCLPDRQPPRGQSQNDATRTQHPSCDTRSAVTETHRCRFPHVQVF